MIYFIIVFSLFFESSFSNIIPFNSILTPLFLITSLVIMYPYFRNKNINFLISCLLCGIFYDVIFSNSSFVNTISFVVFGGIIILGYNYIKYNILSSNILNVVVIVLYRIISYLILCIIDYSNFNGFSLLEGIYNSIIINVIYGIIIYIIMDKISKIFKIKRIE